MRVVMCALHQSHPSIPSPLSSFKRKRNEAFLEKPSSGPLSRVTSSADVTGFLRSNMVLCGNLFLLKGDSDVLFAQAKRLSFDLWNVEYLRKCNVIV